MDRKGYNIKNDSIIIKANQSEVSFYELSKRTIENNSKLIDTCISSLSKFETYNSNINTLKIDLPILRKELEDSIKLLNMYCIFLNFSIDSSIECRELMLAKNKSEQIHYCKQIYIELFRYLERVQKDSQILYSLSIVSNNQDLHKKYTESNRTFKTQYESHIKNRRNKFFAHIKDINNYNEYYNEVLKISIHEVINMCIQFSKVQGILSELYSNIFDNLTNSTINDLIKNRDELYTQMELSKDKIPKEQFELSKSSIDSIYQKMNSIYDK